MSETVRAIHERKQAAARALYEQEDYVRRLGHLSDEELAQELIAALRREKLTVSRWIDSGDCFVLSGAGKVHRPECPSMRQFMDRDAAWEPYFADLERVRDWHGSDNAPDMPKFMTRASVERMETYKTCPVCAPTLDHTDKRPGVRGWTLLKAGSLKTKHFGRTFNVARGEAIGVLTRITTVETKEGLDFRAEFDGIEAPIVDPAMELMYLTPRHTSWSPV